MADNNTNTKQQNKLPFKTRLQLQTFALAKLLYIRRDGTINRRLLNLFDLKNTAPATKRIDTIKVSTSDVLIDPSRNLWLRLFVPNTTNPSNKLPLIVYFHGGGFNTFGPNSKCYDELCCHLAAKVPAVIAYPCQYDDCYSAIKFIDDQNNCTILPPNTDIKNCFVAGDSAGGNIAHHVTFRAHQNSHEFENMKIIGVLLVQPFFGGEERTESELRLKKAPVNVWMDSEVVEDVFAGGC
ncbi:hypothetical protein DH2020_042771 [Rehmannia glutinosa]|uniref:Alpha/beta hydrolase fold-3 domain-containing protein n=1 Tax=Rehmannia glutinosa TaxID=99300 RepID=A0ABR0ULP5_REHGL